MQLTIDTSEELTKLTAQLDAIGREYEQVRKRMLELEDMRAQTVGAIQLVQMYAKRAQDNAGQSADAGQAVNPQSPAHQQPV